MFEKDITEFATLKARQARLTEQMDAMVEQVTGTPEYQELKAQFIVVSEALENTDTNIRTSALEHYKASADKRPHPAIGIRLMTKCYYSEQLAVEWCKDNMPHALKLNKTMFEKHARAVSQTIPLEFVEVATEPQVTISRDLSQYMEGNDDNQQ